MSGVRNLKLEVILSAIDKATRPLKAVLGNSQKLTKQLKETRDSLKQLNQAQAGITAFRQLTKDARETGEKLAGARQKLQQMREQMAALGPPTDAMARRLRGAEIAVDKLTLANRKKIDAAKQAKTALEASGVSVARLGQVERDLAGKIDSTTAAMRRQEEALKRVSAVQGRRRAARANLDARLEFRDKVAGAGASAMATGAAMGAPIIKMVRDYSSFEDAMLGVARQVEGARDANGRLTRTYYEMGDAIKAMSEQIPMATTNIAALVEGGARMGIQGKDNLLTFAKTAATASIAFDLPADQIGEDLGKIANLYKVPIKNLNQLGDVINYLDDNAQSKGGDIINVLQRIAGSTGSMDYKQAAALASTFLSLGAAPEVAATATKAMVRELQIAEKQPKRFQKGLKELGLNAKQIQADMARDSTGTILKVLEAVRKLPKANQMGVMVDLFGKEYGDDAAKLAENIGEYRKQLGLINDAKAKGSMDREGDARKGTLSARWQMLQNKLFNTNSGLGSTLKQPLNETMDMVGKVTDKITAWTKANPELTATLVKTAVVTGAVLAGLGGLLLLVAGFIGPLAMIQFGFSMLNINFTSGIGILGKIGSALRLVGTVVGWLARILLMNPIGLVITLIAAGAYLIWRNWDTLGPKFAALWQGIKDAFSTAWSWIKGQLASFVILYILPMIEAIKQKFAAGWEWIKTKAGEMVDWFKSLPERFKEMGANIMQGLVNGISSGLSSVKTAITSAGESTIAWFKEKLGIHSPSRVFAEQGGFTMAGLHQGIANNQAGPLGAVTNMAKKLTTAGAGIALSAGATLASVPIDTRTPLSAQRATPATSAPAQYIFNIYPSPGMNEQQLAQLVVRQIEQHERQKAARGRSRLTDKD